MSGIVLTFPILPGKEESWRWFCQEISGSQLQMYLSSRRSMGITHERLVLVKNAFGSSCRDHPGSSRYSPGIWKTDRLALPFDVWYRERLQELHGINLDGYEQYLQPTQVPLSQDVYFDWRLNSSDPKKGLTFYVRVMRRMKTHHIT